jgi:signal transduction histidine kinase
MSRASVLVVDDDPAGRNAVTALLSSDGYEVATAPDGPTALRLATELRPDVLLVDVMMPGMDGFDVTRRIRDLPDLAEVPILLLTALDDHKSRIAGLEAGADDFLYKPLDRSDLRARLRTITRLNRFRRLTEQRELYRRLFERSPCGLLVLDAEGRVREANPTAQQLLERWLGPAPHDLRRLLPKEQAGRIGKLLASAADPTATAREDFAVRVGHTPVWFDLSVSLLSAGAGTFLAALTDRTAERTLEQKLQQSERMESIGRLAGGIAHDFNNLLTVINGFTSLALDQLPAGDPVRDGLEQVERAGEQAAVLTRQLLAFGRRSIVTPVHVAMPALVREVEKLLRRLIGEHITVRVTSGPVTGAVWADPAQIEQVLFNLAANARDAMPGGGTLSIHTSEVADPETAPGWDQERNWIRLTVGDTGSGMPPEVRERIFEPFFTTKPVGKGTGLGLATVYGIIVQQCRGRISVDSAVGRGTTFVVDFPRRDAPVSPGAPAAAPKLVGGTETVLLVEDEETVRGFAEATLTSAGYTVLTARDGEDATLRAVAHPGPIHLLFTDVVMPRLGGRALAEQVWRTRPDVKVLLTSGYDDEAMKQTGRPDIAASLQKPYNAYRLLRAVREALDR